MRVLLLGNRKRGIACLDALIDRGDDVVGVVAPPDEGMEEWYPSIAEHARSLDLPVIQPAKVNDPDVVEQLNEWDPDLGIMAGYSQILGSTVLSVPKRGLINLHGGKIPEYRGGSTLNWMIIEGETEGGISILHTEEGIDTGDILLQETFPIELEDTILDVIETTNELFPNMLVTVLDRIEDGSIDPTPQSTTEGAYYHSRRPQHGEVNWHQMTAKNVYDLSRALAGPYPSAYTFHDGEKLAIDRVSLLEEGVCGVPGRVCLRRENGVVAVAQNRGVVIETVTPADGETKDANEYFTTVGVDLGR